MNFEASDVQTAFASTLSRFVAERYDGVKRAAYLQESSGYDRSVWQELAGIGLISLRQRETDGGLGGSAADLMVAMRSLGPALLLDPWLPTLVVSRLISTLGSEEQKRHWLPDLATGQATMGLALTEAGLGHPLMHVSTRARAHADGYILNGSKQSVLAGTADHFLVMGRGEDSDALRLFIVSADTSGLSARRYRAVDGSLLCDLNLQDGNINAGGILGNGDAVHKALEDALAEAFIALSAEAVGIMDAALSQTVEHLKLRKQFGVALASFQVIQHRMADCATNLELVRGLTMKAAMLADNPESPRKEFLRAAFGVKALTSRVARHIAEETVQLHGAIGITEELWVGRAMKRLLMVAALFGDERAQTLYCDALFAGER